jgi:hypothetical protein
MPKTVLEAETLPFDQAVFLLVDRKDPSDRFYREELVGIYFHTGRCYTVADCLESFKIDYTVYPIKIL